MPTICSEHPSVEIGHEQALSTLATLRQRNRGHLQQLLLSTAQFREVLQFSFRQRSVEVDDVSNDKRFEHWADRTRFYNGTTSDMRICSRGLMEVEILQLADR